MLRPELRNWRDGGDIGSVYVLDEHALSRVGDCWLKDRLKVGDVVLCVALSGDCFNNYVLLRIFYNGLMIIPESKFGAYVFSGKTVWQPSKKEFCLLLAEEFL